MKTTIKLKIVLGFLVITGCTGISNKTTVNSNVKDMVATVSSSTKPIYDTGVDLEKNLRATFSGNVYNEKGESVEYALVKAKALDEGVTWVAEYQLTAGGAFVIRNSPVGSKVEITITKNGVSKSKIVNIKPNLYGDPNFNKFDFGHSANDKNSDNNDFLTVDALAQNTDSSIPIATSSPNHESVWDGTYPPSSYPPIIPIRGRVYNQKGELVSHSFVKLKNLSDDTSCGFFEETFGEFNFYSIPPNNEKIRITVSKNGVLKVREITITADILEKSPNIFDFGHSASDKNSTNNDFLNVDANGKNSEELPVFPKNTPTPISSSNYECFMPIPVATPTPES